MFSLTVTEYYKKKNLISISQLVVVSPKIHNFKSLINQFVSRNRIVVTSVSRRSSSLLLTHCLNYRITSQSTIAYQIHRGLSVNQAKSQSYAINHRTQIYKTQQTELVEAIEYPKSTQYTHNANKGEGKKLSESKKKKKHNPSHKLTRPIMKVRHFATRSELKPTYNKMQ